MNPPTESRRTIKTLPAMLAGILAGAVLVSPAISHVGSRIGHLRTHLNRPYLESTRVTTGAEPYEFQQGAFQTVPGTSTSLTIPQGAGNRHVMVTFNSDSRCDGPAGTRCVLGIFIAGAVAEPGFSYFRSGGGPLQSSTVVRSRLLSPGTYDVSVAGGMVNGATAFHVDNWHLSVEVAKP